MFKKNQEIIEQPTVKTESLIGSNVKVDGEFIGQGNLIIEGSLSGKISVENNLEIGQNAKVNAHIEANNAVVSGQIKGNIIVKNELKLLSTANIRGDVTCQKISIDLGAKLNGKCSIVKDENIKSDPVTSSK